MAAHYLSAVLTSNFVICSLLFAILLSPLITFRNSTAQQFAPNLANQNLVSYEKHSDFIKEYKVPIYEYGLRGITTDSQGNAWFLHSTNKTSIIFKLEQASGRFTQYQVKGDTMADNSVINLAAAQLTYDAQRNAVWFSDARTNSIGKIDVKGGQIQTWPIQTKNAGPMGIVLSPDGKKLWLAEITGDKIASFDIQSHTIVEYPTGQNTGPALLTFDDKAELWVSLSFSNEVMQVQTFALLPNSPSQFGMNKMSLPAPDRFSPLGIAVVGSNLYVSDHGSSRVIVADTSSYLQSYNVYWTSQTSSLSIPTTLPGQIVADNQGNVFFPEHGGNRLAEISKDGIMTEWEIPTGPLSTVLFASVSNDGKRIWFTEWASNKVAYLDSSIAVPFEEHVDTRSMVIAKDQHAVLNVTVSSGDNNTAFRSPLQLDVSLAGMTETGLQGVSYHSMPSLLVLANNTTMSLIDLQTSDNAKPGNYSVMVLVRAPEDDSLLVSRSIPISLTLDVPQPAIAQSSPSFNSVDNQSSRNAGLIESIAIVAGIGIVGYLALRRFNRRPTKNRQT